MNKYSTQKQQQNKYFDLGVVSNFSWFQTQKCNETKITVYFDLYHPSKLVLRFEPQWHIRKRVEQDTHKSLIWLLSDCICSVCMRGEASCVTL